jgi:5-methylcytosine-specific restriction protein A
MLFVPGKEYKRTDVHDQVGGSRQSGISTSAQLPLILLFTSETGEQYGYKDAWEGNIFYYVGEGQKGDMEFTRGNLAIRDHIVNGKDLHLFEYIGKKRGYVQYIGQMVCIGYHFGEGTDRDGNNRQIIIFELTPLEEVSQDIQASELTVPPSAEEDMNALSLNELRSRALAVSTSSRKPVERKQDYFYRSQAIKLYAHKRAAGICEGCKQQAPFKTREGSPYLEVHHLRRLSDGGPDDPRWVVAICPNCHRRAHYAEDYKQYNQYLTQIAQDIEQNLA